MPWMTSRSGSMPGGTKRVGSKDRASAVSTPIFLWGGSMVAISGTCSSAEVSTGMPTAAVTEMCSTANGKLVGMDDELIAKVQAKYPWYSKFTIPAGTYDRQAEPVQTTAVKMLLLTDASMPDDVVYDLAKTFWENLDSLGKAHAVMKTVTKEMAVSDLSGIPLHPGAEKYYREIGLLK